MKPGRKKEKTSLEDTSQLTLTLFPQIKSPEDEFIIQITQNTNPPLMSQNVIAAELVQISNNRTNRDYKACLNH